MAEFTVSNLNIEQVESRRDQVETNAAQMNEIVDKIIYAFISELDEYMKFVREIISDPIRPPSAQELDDITLNIPVLLYFVSQGQEEVGLKEDIAKAFKIELYSKSYEQADGTVGDRKAAADLKTQTEELTQIAYNRAYKKIKLKIEMASETLQSVKKVVTRRAAEYELSRIGGNK